MAIIGGSVESISLDGRQWAVPGDTDITIGKGGFSNEHKAHGNGTGRTIKERKQWMMEGVGVACSAERGDHAFLQNMADGSDIDVVITFTDGSTLNGTGNIEGELKYSTQNAVASFGLAGSGTLEQ